jgi:hypothetical protein
LERGVIEEATEALCGQQKNAARKKSAFADKENKFRKELKQLEEGG